METINERVLPLSKKNYELWLVRYAEGELTTAERQEVETWLAGHPEAAEELRLYNEAPRLQRDESVLYVAAMPPQTKPLWSTAWRWVAAAAVVLLLLTPMTLSLFRGNNQPVEVAQITLPPSASAVVDSVVVATPSRLRPRPIIRQIIDEEVASQQLFDCVENYASPLPLPISLPQTDVQELFVMASEEQQLVYVDNLFVEDTTTDLEQYLLATNDAAKEALQGTWLGRRLARRLPDDEQLLAKTGEVRERIPRGFRMVADAIRVYKESTK